VDYLVAHGVCREREQDENMSILNRATGGEDQMQADVIVAAVMTGFVATRIALVQPVLFTFEEGEDLGSIRDKSTPKNVLHRLTRVLQPRFDPDAIGGLKCAAGPGGTPLRNPSGEWLDVEGIKTAMTSGRSVAPTSSVAITARQGGTMVSHSQDELAAMQGTYVDRNRTITNAQVRSQVSQIIAALQFQPEYGAYYGVVDDPVTEEGGFCCSSVRRIIPYTGGVGLPRWNRGAPYHGLIGGAGGRDVRAQWGSFEREGRISGWDGQNGVVGYTHGMMWAIQRAKQIGPWATPYEVAVGAVTRKLASCFACTTFMYATGYPPSGVHMGSADSWVPLPPQGAENPHWTNMTILLNEMWANDVAHYLTLGADILSRGGVAPAARAQVQELRGVANAQLREALAATMYLDALTMHKNDRRRLDAVLAD
jgi:hypothetical protein